MRHPNVTIHRPTALPHSSRQYSHSFGSCWIANGLAFAMLFSSLAFGADEKAATPAAKPATPLRDPFWPVGYAAPTPIPTVEANTVESTNQTSTITTPEAVATPIPTPTPIAWPELVLKAIVKKPKAAGFMALIDKVGLVEEGKTVSVQSEGVIYSWKITKITATGLSQVRLEAKPVN